MPLNTAAKVLLKSVGRSLFTAMQTLPNVPITFWIGEQSTPLAPGAYTGKAHFRPPLAKQFPLYKLSTIVSNYSALVF